MAKVSKYFDRIFQRAEDFQSSQKCCYELNFNGQTQRWTWAGLLDRSGNRILSNIYNYSSDTYLAINSEKKIVGGYSLILESGYEGTVMDLLPAKHPISLYEKKHEQQ